MSIKEANLKKRLDDLENELKSLHARVAKKWHPLQHNKAQLKSNEHLVEKKAKVNEHKPINKCKTKTSWAENSHQGKNDCWVFLRNISKNIAKGSEAIHKIASLTEISSLSGRVDTLYSLKDVHSHFNDRHFSTQWPYGIQEDNTYRKKKSKFVPNKNVITRPKATCSESSLFQFEKPVKKIHFSQNALETPTTPPTRDKDFPFELELLKNEMEDRLKDVRILKEKIEHVKKKLRDERSKREIAEKAIASYRRRLAVLEGKKTKDENNEVANHPSSNQQNKVSTIEKELKAEHKKRTDAEQKVKELMRALEETRNEISKLEDSRKLAVAMADQFRERTCLHDPQEYVELKADNVALQEEVKLLQQKAEATPAIVDKLLERAERAEKELIEKMKQCNAYMARSTLNDQEIQEVLRCHKEAYKELQIEMNYKEAELQNQCTLLEKQFQEAKRLADKKCKELNKKYNQAVHSLQQAESFGENLKAERSRLEDEIKDLKKRLKDISEANNSLEESIKSLNENLLSNREEMNKLRTECKRSKEVQSSFEEKLKELNDIVIDRDQTIESLRMELERNKDTIKIKEKMLQDQMDTIKCLRTVSDNTKKTLDDERAQKQKLRGENDKLQLNCEMLEKKLATLEKRLKDNEELQLVLKKSNESLKLLDSEVSSRQEDLEKQLLQLTSEKEQAIQTARFATEKLVQTVNDYELKLCAQKKLHKLLTDSLREREFQLDVANQQINELNEDLWKSARASEQIRNDLQSKLKKACEVCTDVLETQIDREF